jgi:ribosomal protein S18 acetylase RimI-like enzyme
MIRKATIEDQQRITEVRNAVRENQLSPANIPKVADVSRWIFENGAFWVWEQHGAVQGFSAADPRDGTIFALFVHPDYESRGIGPALLSLACEDLRRAGRTVAKLTTAPGSRAERFYRRNGWTDIGREKGEIVFERALTRE